MAGDTSRIQALEQRDSFFTRVVQQHARLLYRVAYSVLRDAEDAEDAVADAMLKLLRTRAWRNITQERAFLARAVWRCALDCQTRRKLLDYRFPNGAVSAEPVDERPSPERAAADGDMCGRLHRLIDGLPEELRGPLLLSAVHELNSREIGELLQLPEGTVRTRLMRARQRIREEYAALLGATHDNGQAAKIKEETR